MMGWQKQAFASSGGEAEFSAQWCQEIDLQPIHWFNQQAVTWQPSAGASCIAWTHVSLHIFPMTGFKSLDFYSFWLLFFIVSVLVIKQFSDKCSILVVLSGQWSQAWLTATSADLKAWSTSAVVSAASPHWMQLGALTQNILIKLLWPALPVSCTFSIPSSQLYSLRDWRCSHWFLLCFVLFAAHDIPYRDFEGPEASSIDSCHLIAQNNLQIIQTVI